ncbi:MAG: DUF4038 domain-containing protein, partial [Verrucomicrobiota bacterium]
MKLLLAGWLVALFGPFVFQAPGQDLENTGLHPWKENPRYWAMNGKPVVLIGGSDDDNLFQWPADTLIPQLDRLVEAGGNLIRNTMSDRQDLGVEVYPFKRLENDLYDLDQWNPEYWKRVDRMLEETARRGIVVQIEIWDRFDYSDVRKPHWQKHPYRPANNVTYSEDDTGLADRYPDHPGANKQPFFFSTPEQRNIGPLLRIQNRFVDHLL